VHNSCSIPRTQVALGDKQGLIETSSSNVFNNLAEAENPSCDVANELHVVMIAKQKSS